MALIRIPHPDITELPRTQLTADTNASDGTLTVANANPFKANSYLILESLGSAKAEFIRVNGADQSGTTINLDGSNEPVFGHTKGTTVQAADYNQVAIEYSTDFETNWDTGNYSTLALAEAASTWTALITIDLQPSQEVTVYNDGTATRRSYRTRFFNSQATFYSNYSSPILPDGFEGQTVGSIIERALRRTNQKVNDSDTSLITWEFLLGAFLDGLYEVHYTRKRWSWNSNYDFTLSDITAGVNSYSLPVDIDITDTRKSIYNVRVNNGKDLHYIDKREYDRLMAGVHNTTLAGSLTSSSSTIVVADSSDLPDSGAFSVTTDTTRDSVSFSANNRSTNTLTLSSAATDVTVTHASGQNIWVGENHSVSTQYTVWEDSLILYPIPDTTIHLRTISMDYYKTLPKITDQEDYILVPDPMILMYYMCMVISDRLNETDESAKYESRYRERLAIAQRMEATGKKNVWKLKLTTGGNPVRGYTRSQNNLDDITR